MAYQPTPNDIEFTQYLMPNGRQDTVWIERPDAVVEKAKTLRAAGFRFECEMLSDYQTISLTIHDPQAEEDVAIEVIPNGPAVPEAVDRMILGFEPASKARGQ